MMWRRLLPMNVLRRFRAGALQTHHILFFERNGIAVFHDIAMPGQTHFFTPTATEIPDHADELQSRFGVSHSTTMLRYAHGCTVRLAHYNGQIVSMLWTAYHEQPVSEIGVVLTLGSDEYATFNARTLPAWRGHGLSTRLNDEVSQAAQALGRTRHLSWRRSDNKSALRVAQKLQQEPIGVASATYRSGARTTLDLQWHTPRPPLLRDTTQGID
jgi:GNAT superfamily N-acetyltransferase